MKRLSFVVVMGGCLALRTATFANCVTPPSGILAWWPGEGNANDIAGANAGTLWNGATATAPGLAGSAFGFDGTNQYVSLPDNLFPFPPMAPAGTPFSFETWFKTGAGGVILGQQSGVPFTGVGGWVPAIYVGTDGNLRVQAFWNGSANPMVSTHSVADESFHHVAFTYDGTNESVYLDGRLVNARPFAQVSYASSYKYQVGAGYTGGWPGGNGWYAFSGVIDEPALYNRALSSNEVAAIYGAGGAGKCRDSLPPVITAQPSSLEAPVGSAVTLQVGVNGAAPLTYQWQFEGANLPGQTNVTLVLPNLAAAQSGAYLVSVANAYGSAQSSTGTVTVVFPLTLDATVTNGVPFAGAGDLESPAAQDIYSFEAPPSRLVYLGVLSSFSRLFWSLTAPDGTAVFTAHYMPYDDIRRLELPTPGQYRLTVYNDSGLTGAYSFRISAVTDQVFNIAPGATVTNGVPAPGAGNIEMAGSIDEYLFTEPSNGLVYLGVLSSFNRLFWSLTAPDGSAVFNAHYMPYNDVGQVQLPLPGTYRLRVYNDAQFTGPYSFELLGEADQAFNIAVGDTVTNGAPAPGAGNLETPGAWDDYLFTAPPNRLVYLDALASFSHLYWSLYGPEDAPVFSSQYMPYNNVGRVALPQPGTYRLRVYSDNGTTGTYSFRLSGVTDQTFSVAVGAAVTNGAPAPGAGNLEVPGAFDDYLFQAPTNRAVYLDVLSAPSHFCWTLYAPDSSTVFSAHYMPYNDVGRLDLPQSGTYRLRVYSDADATGPYSFKLWDVLDQSFAISIGNVVTNGAPAPGAGVLASPGADHLFTFDANAGQKVHFNDRNSSPTGSTATTPARSPFLPAELTFCMSGTTATGRP